MMFWPYTPKNRLSFTETEANISTDLADARRFDHLTSDYQTIFKEF